MTKQSQVLPEKRKTALSICPRCEEKTLGILVVQTEDGQIVTPDDSLVRRILILDEGRGLPRCPKCQQPCEHMGVATYPLGDEAAMKSAFTQVEQDWRIEYKKRGGKLGQENQKEEETG